MKTASILSFQFANNYGAILQIYALSETLKKLNLEVEVIDYRPLTLSEPHNPRMNVKHNLKTTGLSSTMKSLAVRTFKYKSSKKRTKNFKQFKNQFLNMTEKSYSSNEELHELENQYDYFFVGSDQVWNPYYLESTNSSYFLNFAGDHSKKISYAASIAATSLNNSNKKLFEENLENIDCLSVREQSGKELIDALTSKEVKVTLDPTLLLKKDEWYKIADSKQSYDKFILVYDLEKTTTIINLANKLSEKTGYKIISFSRGKEYINHYFSFVEKNLNEFLGLFKEAEFVITSSFHGTVFSVICEKNFLTVPHTTRGSRMIDLLHSIGLNDRLIYSEDTELPQEIINYTEPNKKLDELRKDSIQFIKESL